jgi:3-phosphoshikimate 1-carboxyvinyltransferase
MTSTVILQKKGNSLSGEVNLPFSKSISNRLLIINALSGGKVKFENLSDAQDTAILKHALHSRETIIDAGHAGTAFRFLTAYFSVTAGERILTGSERMKQRPVGTLVDALRKLGADIEYLEKENYPPLKIKGKQLSGGSISIDADVSSQFISALLMIAPHIKGGLYIRLTKEKISAPYLTITAELMRKCGARVEETAFGFKVPEQNYLHSTIAAERDWSAAAFFYQLAAFSEESEILLKGLSEHDIQGDKILSEIFAKFGVKTSFTEPGCLLQKSVLPVVEINFDFKDCPDLAQPLAVTMAGLGVKGKLTGLKTLRIKETDRIHALVEEFKKIGIHAIPGEDFIIMPGTPIIKSADAIKTYDDHRMAMSFAPLAQVLDEIEIEEPAVVKKSFPKFWNEISGFLEIND